MIKINFFKIILKKSLIGINRSHKMCALGLGLKKINDVVYIKDTYENRGMIEKIRYIINIF